MQARARVHVHVRVSAGMSNDAVGRAGVGASEFEDKCMLARALWGPHMPHGTIMPTLLPLGQHLSTWMWLFQATLGLVDQRRYKTQLTCKVEEPV